VRGGDGGPAASGSMVGAPHRPRAVGAMEEAGGSKSEMDDGEPCGGCAVRSRDGARLRAALWRWWLRSYGDCCSLERPYGDGFLVHMACLPLTHFGLATHVRARLFFAACLAVERLKKLSTSKLQPCTYASKNGQNRADAVARTCI
jgi:hypothetical protein